MANVSDSQQLCRWLKVFAVTTDQPENLSRQTIAASSDFGASVPVDGDVLRSPVEIQTSAKERRLSILFSCAAFFTSYVITAGPAAFITRKFDQPMFESIVKAIYAPLILIIKLKIPIIAPAIKAWVELFR